MIPVIHTCKSADGTDIHVEVYGSDGPPIVFIPGLGDNMLSWTAQAKTLSGDFQVVLIDNRGAGESATPVGPYSTEQMADDAHQVIAILNLAPVTAVGISMGGAICQHWAIRHPSDISRLVLSSTWGAPDVFIGALFDHWRGLAKKGDRRALIESLLVFCYSPGYLTCNPGTVDAFIEGETLNLNGFAPAAVACRDHLAFDHVHRISQPVLMLVGEHDILIRPKLSYALAERLENVRVQTMPTGHMTSWEMPNAFNDLVYEFAKT
jgi:pimeloyl-ACP methyl ester carboxylesterase